jgi:hypothetical protein
MSTASISTPTPQQSSGEISRFASILKRHLKSNGPIRNEQREVLVSYIKFSPNWYLLINELILNCVASDTADRLDTAIDILFQLDGQVQVYTRDYLEKDINQWNKLYPSRKFMPNDDYWYVLLRSLGRCVNKNESLQILSVCQDENSRGVAEGLVEALGDLGTEEAANLLRNISQTSEDSFIKELAAEILEEVSPV